jgi:phospho-N-acetylmuramoyl-pentapeptide-transferase
MLYHLLYPLHTVMGAFNVFRYITFRTVMAILSALIISFLLTPWLIQKLNEWRVKADKR